MQRVGTHLAKIANGSPDPVVLNLFARSAFNRFYYTVFLVVRDFLFQINPAWAKTSHAKVPELLRDQVVKKLKNEIKKTIRADPSFGYKLKKSLVSGTAAAHNLADMMTAARSIRTIADYEVEILVERDTKGTLLLRDYSLHSAENWERHGLMNTKTILRAYRDAGII